jgi:phospholipid-binding lipoprotein MlaA
MKLRISFIVGLSILSFEKNVWAENKIADDSYYTRAPQTKLPDPYEPLNRGLYRVHNVIDRVIIEPPAALYFHIIPKDVRARVTSILQNLQEPVYMINHIVQGKGPSALTNLKRFLINSTLGFGGLLDVASKIGIESSKTSMDKTLESHGAKTGPYLIVPGLGPTNFRNFLGLIIDQSLNPATLAGWFVNHESWINYTRTGLKIIDERSGYLDTIKKIRRESVDPYATIKSAVTQKWLHSKGEASQKNYGDHLDWALGKE